MRSLLERLALHRPELRAWALYDWANSVYMTSVLSTLLPLYFRTVAGADLPQGVATARFAMATACAVTIVALISPFLGALADLCCGRLAIGARSLGFCKGELTFEGEGAEAWRAFAQNAGVPLKPQAGAT